MLNSEGTIAIIASSGSIGNNDIGFTSLGDFVLNNQNLVAYDALNITFEEGATTFDRNIFVGENTAILIVEGFVSDLALNDSELLVFSINSSIETGTFEEVFQAEGEQITSIGNTDGLFAFFEEIALNNAEEIVFSGFLDDEGNDSITDY